MSTVTALLVGIAVGMIAVLSSFWVAGRLARISKPAAPAAIPDVALPPLDEQENFPQFEEPAMPMDPENMPVTRVFNPVMNRRSPYPVCHCHGTTLQPGETVLWWPMPQSHGGGVRIFHQNWIHDQVPNA